MSELNVGELRNLLDEYDDEDAVVFVDGVDTEFTIGNVKHNGVDTVELRSGE